MNFDLLGFLDLNPFKMLLKGIKDNEKSVTFILKIYELFRMKHLIPTKAVSLETQSSLCNKVKINGILTRKSAFLCCANMAFAT